MNADYKDFGDSLKGLRRKFRESIADVSGAVEIDASLLGELEAGQTQPAREILLLLISHFSLKDDEAKELWAKAGYERENFGVVTAEGGNASESLPYSTYYENPILYTDMVHVSANGFGVIINFLQGLAVDGKPSAIARVGMSREHAKSLIEVLEKTLRMSDGGNQPPKILPDITSKNP